MPNIDERKTKAGGKDSGGKAPKEFDPKHQEEHRGQGKEAIDPKDQREYEPEKRKKKVR